jgi:hypothetical protein
VSERDGYGYDPANRDDDGPGPYVFHPTPTGHVSHSFDTTCDLCDFESCVECGHTVEDDAHADGCEECACPLHLTIGDLNDD